MLLTLDTNVILQALSSHNGASAKIVDDIFSGNLELALSVPVFQEYEDVLSRPSLQKKLGFSHKEALIFLNALLKTGKRQKIYYLWRPNLKDEKDNLFVELALASQSQFLITSNLRDFQQMELVLQGCQILTPAMFIQHWRVES